MDIIYLKKGEGKTKRLIEMANGKAILIIVSSRKRASEILQMSYEMNCKIHLPVTMDEAMNLKGGFIESFLIDDVDEILQSLLHKRIDAITIRAN